MSFRKITITLPEPLYERGMEMVKKGLFSNFSDLVRSGIREECKGMHNMAALFDEDSIYADPQLLKTVALSIREAKDKKGYVAKTKHDAEKYLDDL